MGVPFVDLGRFVDEIADEVRRDFDAVLSERAFLGGPRVEAFERSLATALGVRSAIACSNGSDALVVALRALGVGAGMRVAVPNLTFFATFEAVAHVGAEPVLVDVEPDTLQVAPETYARAAEEHGARAALHVHLFGWASPRLGELRATCASRGITLVEDAAQAFGVEVEGEPVLAGAGAATLSFHPAKVLGGAADGGAIVVADARAEALARSLASHGRRAHYAHDHVGYNARMGGLAAAYLSRALAASPRALAWRRRALARYAARLEGVPGVRVLGPPRGVVGNGYLAVLEVEPALRSRAIVELRAREIGFATIYPETIDAQAPARGARRVGDLAASRAFVERALDLPLFHGIRDDEIDEACDAVLAAVGAGASRSPRSC